jgi:eukaryotic-like serine/threonine-protein kinase
MPRHEPSDIDGKSPPFDQFTSLQPLATSRGGRRAVESARHRLYVARDKRSRTSVLIKVTSKPGLIYQHSLTNEIASLSTINRELPDSRHFPVLVEHGSLRDGRVYLITSLFDEFPLATVISPERMPARMVTHLMTAIEIARALEQLHGLEIYHVDLNPMNVLYRTEKNKPVIRIVDFESSYERPRHSTGVSYNPSTTPGYSAPEVSHQAPDGRSDLFSLGAVLYTMVAGFGWSWEAEVDKCVTADREIDPELKGMLLSAVDPNPDKRYPSVRDFHAALAAYLEQIWPGRSW